MVPPREMSFFFIIRYDFILMKRNESIDPIYKGSDEINTHSPFQDSQCPHRSPLRHPRPPKHPHNYCTLSGPHGPTPPHGECTSQPFTIPKMPILDGPPRSLRLFSLFIQSLFELLTVDNSTLSAPSRLLHHLKKTDWMEQATYLDKTP